MKRLLLLLLLHLALQGFSQDYKRTYNWYFGAKAGLTFSDFNFSVSTNGAMDSEQGSSTISDTNGTLLFYTNGETVWNKNHQIMQNGKGLLGDQSSTQSSVVVPIPGNDSLYYIFTAEGGYIFGLQASLVNINAQGGLGEVTLKNIPLVAPICEALVATRHQNGRDVWVLTKSYPGNLFYAFLVTESGIITCPVVTAIGVNYTSTSTLGVQATLKFSADGTKLASGLHYDNNPAIELFDFDKATGRLSNWINIPATKNPSVTNISYDIEFSLSKRYLYYSNWFNYLCRYDLSLSIGDSIAAHRDTLYKPPGGNWLLERPRGIQLTPNNKILVAVDDSLYISSIETPDSINCGYITRSINLGGKRSLNGLPNFISSYFYRPRLDFGYKRDCSSDTIRFVANDTLNRNNWNWQFKKIADGSTSSAFIQNPIHRFVDTGNYEVRLVAGMDTVIKKIHIGLPPQINLGKDTMLCGNDSIVLTPGDFHCYRWQDSSKASTYSAKQTGTYWVMVTDKDFCQVQDSIHITFNAVPAKPTLLRSGDTLFAPQGNFTYQWFKDNVPITGVDFYTVRSTDGSYQVKITNNVGCSIFSDPYNTADVYEFANNNIRIYPNPAYDAIRIVGATGATYYRIYNLLGQQVLSGYCGDEEEQLVFLQQLRSGYYQLLLGDIAVGYQSFKLVKE